MKKFKEIPDEAQPLVDALMELPEDQQNKLAKPLYNLIRDLGRRKRIISLFRDAIGQLRLDMNYLMFDLEVTRRERDEYQRQLGTK